ncbi:hypothetical protein A3860_39235 [Niastella vici]|uniref:Uncharacterized protein n=1 Tax=Niastella vici TaxID=1703345 RepID=A0A1V9FKG8_9BACT|nr:hypothetical protein [Niastella vici]OQP58845.1 hypothetical protein A3860_39235 [Niastella vici]
MTEQNREMATPFTEVVTNKIQKQAEQITVMQEKLKSTEETRQDIIDIKKQLTDIKVAITGINFLLNKWRNYQGIWQLVLPY